MEKMTGKLWLVLILCFFGTTVIYVPYYGHSTQTLTLMEDFHLNYTQMGMLDSVSALSAGIVMIFAGILLYKWGARNVTLLGLSIALLGQILFAFATGYGFMIFCRIIQGIGISLVFVGPYGMVLRWYEETSHLGFALGVMIACDGAGALLSLYALAYIYLFVGWKLGTLAGAAMLAIMLILSWAFLKEPDRWERIKAKQDAKTTKEFLIEMKEIFINRNTFAACMFIIPVWGLYSVAAYWVPSALMEDAGWSEANSGLVGTFFTCAGMFAFIFGIISDKTGKRKPLTIISGIGTTISFGLLAVFYVAGQYVLVAIMLILSGFFAYAGLLLAYYLVSDGIGAVKSGTANGLIMAVGYLIGGFVYPLVVAYFKDTYDSYAVGFVAITITIAIFCVVGVFPGRDTPKELRPID